MKVFISWSGERSHGLALAMKDWISNVLQFTQPFVSSEDIQKGARWFEAIGGELEDTHFGILCLTPDNLTAPWILFEAGALSKKLGQANVAPVRLNVTNGQLIGPLAQFNTAEANKSDLKKLLKTINERSGDKTLAETKFESTYDMWWPGFEAQLKNLQKDVEAKEISHLTPHRGVPEMLEEVLTLVRSMAREQKTDQRGFEMAIDVGAGIHRKTAIPVEGFAIQPARAGLSPQVMRNFAAHRLAELIDKGNGDSQEAHKLAEVLAQTDDD